MMNPQVFCNKKILLTAGPTREAIDPVRYVSNHSSGKMGYAIAKAFLDRGAIVTLVSGPVNLQLIHSNLDLIPVQSAAEMYDACKAVFSSIDVAVFSAAVADYRPETIATQKIKKEDSSFVIRMVKNIDIAFEFGKDKTDQQLSVGFALETNNELEHAQAKLRKKHFDLVVLNSMKDANATFGYDTNKVRLITQNEIKEFPLKTKTEVAVDIVDEVAVMLDATLSRIHNQAIAGLLA